MPCPLSEPEEPDSYVMLIAIADQQFGGDAFGRGWSQADAKCAAAAAALVSWILAGLQVLFTCL